MIALLQRVTRSSVKVDGNIVGEIGLGLNILLGIFKGDSEEDIQKLVNKIIALRIFSDEAGKMNLSLQDVGGSLLVISQFTLAGDCRKGRRPSFDFAEKPDSAEALYEAFVYTCKEHVLVESGVFGAMMDVDIQNDGPVTFILDSRQL